MTPYSLGFFPRASSLTWALAGFGKDGWALVDAGSVEEPIESAIPKLQKSWPKNARPRLGVQFGKAHCRVIIGDRPVRQIVSAERIDQNDETLLVKVVPFGQDRMSVSLPRHAVAELIEPWRVAGVEPLDVEPLEIAWSRTYPAVDALVHMPTLAEGNLVVFGDRHIHTERLPDLSAGLDQDDVTANIVEHIRQARGEVERLQSVVLHGDGLDDVPTMDGDLDATPCAIAGEISPAWADAFVLSLAAAVVRK